MKVLVAEYDLFHNMGGGQTAYRRLIATNPAVEFYYLGQEEQLDAPRPANAHLIPLVRAYRKDFAIQARDPCPPEASYDSFLQTSNIAASVAGMEFDVVETADFRDFGALLRPAMVRHGVRFGRTVLALHGRVSNSKRLDWESPGDRPQDLDLREQLQYRSADTRYGISRSYLQEWQRAVELPAHYLNPLRLLEPPRPTLPAPATQPPDLHFVGRTEKLKGPDIFLDLVWWLPRDSYGEASIIGPQSFFGENGGSNVYLRAMMSHRTGDVALRGAMSPEELRTLFAGRSVICLPSRYDTLNLIAFESLFSGCPTVVGTGAGACHVLRESLPEVPYLALDIRNVYGCLPAIRELLADYDRRREELVRALERFRPSINGATPGAIYASAPGFDPSVRDQMDRAYDHLARQYEAWDRSLRRRVKQAVHSAVKGLLPAGSGPKLRHVYQLAKGRAKILSRSARSAVLGSAFRGDAILAYHAKRAPDWGRRYRQLTAMGEHTDRDLAVKLQACWSACAEFRVDSVRLWHQIARLERKRGNELMAAAYELRIMRALGEDRLGHLDATAASLRRCGFPGEAEAAEAMFGPPERRTEACRSLLERAREKHRSNPPQPWERIDDRRPACPGTRRVAVIVSLYKAADKLSFFLHALANQTLLKRGAMEVILVDSGSPDREHEVFAQCMESLRMPVVYARSPQRETIQAAWNRGIALARAPYLAFLGADETVLPDALEVLAAELDADPGLDWVTGTSLMTEVDELGTWKKDVMLYDRSDFHPTLPYLDTCYLSWVGALYRRSIHERFGYYDPTFGAAGDTEFKYRVLPWLKTRSIPRTLGLFLNYPGVRTTESPRAEIEDLRAWYLNRTLGGVLYAFDGRDPEEALGLFYRCLRYHKSFWKHSSTDVEYASQLAAYLEERAPGLLTPGHAGAVRGVLAAYRSIDWLAGLSSWGAVHALWRARRVAGRERARQGRLSVCPVKPAYQVFNDNRFEQHRNVWRS